MKSLVVSLFFTLAALNGVSAFSVILIDVPSYYHPNSLSADYDLKFGDDWLSTSIGYNFNTDSQDVFANAQLIHLRGSGSVISGPLNGYSSNFLDWVATGGVLYIDNLEGGMYLPDFNVNYSFGTTNNIKAPDISHELIIQSGISWIHYTPGLNHTFSSVNLWGGDYTAIFNFYNNFNWSAGTALAIRPYGEGNIIFSTGYFGASISEYALSLSTIPEPSSYALLFGGLALGLVALRRR